jgi:hypothetical protein
MSGQLPLNHPFLNNATLQLSFLATFFQYEPFAIFVIFTFEFINGFIFELK